MRQHILYTSIGGACCACHGCWVPHSVVNFERGERYALLAVSPLVLTIVLSQKNMDYCCSESLKYNTKGLQKVVLYYDIMCQYWVHMMERFAANPYLSLPEGLNEISRAIGLFHVHGHKDECFSWYASMFIPGAGIVDGEIIETLWEPLNPIVPSTHKATPEHRQEIIDDHMNDSNWKKLLCMGEFPRKSCLKSSSTCQSTSFMCKIPPCS